MAALLANDLDTLQLTAAALGASEYQIFVEAYRAWHGVDPTPAQIERLFGRYLRRSEVPPFVRHFARHYLTEHPEFLERRAALLRKRQQLDRLSLWCIAAAVVLALTLL